MDLTSVRKKLSLFLLSQLRNKISPQSRPTVGLDIGSSQVKMIELQKKEGDFHVVNYGINKIEGDISQAVKDVMKDIENKEVRISLSGPDVIVRHIDLPKMTKEELSKSLQFEIEKYLPFKSEEMFFDWQILEQSVEKTKVLLCAAKKDFVEQRIKIVREAGLKVQLIDVDSLCLVNSFCFNAPSESNSICLLNIGTEITNLSIIKKGKFCLARDVELVTSSPEKLVNEIGLCFDFYESQYEGKVEKIYLSGGTKGNLKIFLEEKLGIFAKTWNPLQSVKTEDFEEIKKEKDKFAIAVGLAIR